MFRYTLIASALALVACSATGVPPYDEEEGKAFLDSLGDPEKDRASALRAMASPKSATRLFQIAEYTNHKAVRDQATRLITLWLADKPELKYATVERLAKDNEVSRTLAALLEHRQRLNPWNAGSDFNVGLTPKKKVPEGADWEPSAVLERMIRLDMAKYVNARVGGPDLIAKKNHLTNKVSDAGWDAGETVSPETVPYYAKPHDGDPFGRGIDRRPRFSICFEQNDGAMSLGTFTGFGVLGRGPNRHLGSSFWMLGVEGELVSDSPACFGVVWINGDWDLPRREGGATANVTVSNSLVVCTGRVRTHGARLTLSDAALITREKWTDAEREFIVTGGNGHLFDGDDNFFAKFKPSDAANYGAVCATEGKYTVVKTVKGESPLGNAGLKPDDLIIKVSGIYVKSAVAFGRELCRAEMGKRAAVVQIERGKETHFLYTDLTAR